MATILVIDDQKAIRTQIVAILRSEQYKILNAENGEAGIELAIQKQPDLILCDVIMPKVNGYEVLDRLRENPKTATIPFIFMTGLSDKESNRKGMELGADDYLLKPFTADELLQAIKTRLKKQEVFTRLARQELDELRENIRSALPHELRTPLNSILGFSDLLLCDLEKLKQADIREMLEQIYTSGQRLYRTIQNFLLYAELELAASDRDRSTILQDYPTNLVEGTIADQARLQAFKLGRSSDLELDLQDGFVAISSELLAKLLEELIDNAFKFSDPGTPVTIISSVTGDRFLLSVQDKGRGMTAEQIDKIGAYLQFERRIYEQQGSGLGLTIAKRIAQLHDGNLSIESVPHYYTIVRVSLPIADKSDSQ
ncbi:response regulator [Spirulina sp. 06S082]|uniref:hybrid sensor histidine kinase/response regulator n=1 Tax=Spirulina sp. 06S082 TaxID=3110248 RepID=UPI002B1EB42F|nr:response regulator [Spirulina sp. 06S082]MEA5468027.1 response regulator [Spirulina sp. 06S082]